MTYRFPIHVGDRVAIAPHHDLWMAGCRFGEVESIHNVEHRAYFTVRLDTGRAVSFWKEDLLGAVGDRPSATPSTEGPGYRIVGGMNPRFEQREDAATGSSEVVEVYVTITSEKLREIADDLDREGRNFIQTPETADDGYDHESNYIGDDYLSGSGELAGDDTYLDYMNGGS